MPPGRKSTSTSSKSSLSNSEQQSSSFPDYGSERLGSIESCTTCALECGSVVWCKYKKYPYWPGIIWEKISKSSRTLYEVLFFGTFSLGLYVGHELAYEFSAKCFSSRSIDRKWLEPFKGVVEFKKRIAELKASEVRRRCVDGRRLFTDSTLS
jgi:PWWP domain